MSPVREVGALRIRVAYTKNANATEKSVLRIMIKTELLLHKIRSDKICLHCQNTKYNFGH